MGCNILLKFYIRNGDTGMLFAVDKYQIGTEREVAAKAFFGQFIANKKGRFFCQECGERVFWKSRGGSNPDMFCHEKRTDVSPECDKRVDGNSGLFLYQRIGLPMFISKAGGIWHLEIGFPALGHDLLQTASEKNTVVLISAGEKTRRREVDFSNFFSDRTTKIPIDIIPSGKDRYKISLNYSRNIACFHRKPHSYCVLIIQDRDFAPFFKENSSLF